MNLMKSLLAVLLVCMTGAGWARDYVAVLSPHQSPEALNDPVGQLIQFATEMDHGDRMTFVDGDSLSTIGVFQVPEDTRYSSRNARLKANQTILGALSRFVRQAKPPKGSGAPGVVAALRMPQVLRKVAAMRSGDVALDVIALGSVRYDDPSEPAFSMAERIPGDGHLGYTAGTTPYGVAGHEQSLSGVRVHWVYPDALSDRPDYYIRRWWTLFVEAQAGKLVSYGHDLIGVLNRVKSHADAPGHQFERNNTDKLEMFRLRQVELIPAQSLYERPVSDGALAANTWRHAENVQVGITWSCLRCDIDLHAQSDPTAEVLFYGRTHTSEGTFFKNFTSAPAVANGQETIASTVPVDLEALRLAVNFYGGQAPAGGVHGEVRLAVADQTFAWPFHLSALSGNSGRDVTSVLAGTANASPHTVLLTARDIVRSQGV